MKECCLEMGYFIAVEGLVAQETNIYLSVFIYVYVLCIYVFHVYVYVYNVSHAY